MPRRTSQTRPHRRKLFEALEARAMFSAVPTGSTPVDTFVWDGHKVTANRGEYVVHLNDGYGAAALTSHKGLSDVTSLGGFNFFSVKTNLSPAEMAKFAARNSKSIDVLSPNAVRQVASAPTVTPNDTQYPLQYYLNNTGPVVPDPVALPVNTGLARQQGVTGADIGAEKAWGITTGSKNVVVAVLDTGIDVKHPDLLPNLWTSTIANPNTNVPLTIHGFDAVSDTQDYDVTDLVGHGTAVAGVIAAAGNNGMGVTGINWNATILPIRVSTDGSVPDDAVIRGINLMDQAKIDGMNIAVANGSFGGVEEFARDTAYARAFSIASQLGIVFVSAAGNDSTNNDTSYYTPTNFAIQNSHSVTVAATDNQDNLTTFSNYGAASVQVAAPGQGIYTTAPTYTVTDFTTLGYGYIDGTSFSSPVTAGIIALEKAAMPTATADQLLSALYRGVDKKASLSGKVTTGGRVDAYNSLRALFNKVDSSNLTTAGGWKNKYGRTASLVYGQNGASTNTLGGILVGTSSGASTKSFARASGSDARALQLPAGNTASRSTKALSASGSLTYTLDTGTASDVFTLYAAALDNAQRGETITLKDTDTGITFDSATLSAADMKAGKYVSFDIKGKVTVTVTSNISASAIVNGIFVDPAVYVDPGGTKTAATLPTDTTTGGNWAGVYGSQGVYLPGDSSSLLSGAKVSVSGTSQTVYSTATNDPAAPRRLSAYTAGTSASGFVAPLTSGSTINVNITVPDSQTRAISLYMADPQKKTTGSSRIDVYDTGGDLLNSQIVSDFSHGKYVRFEATGSVKVKITTLSNRGAVLSGVFLDGTLTNFGTSTTTDATTGAQTGGIQSGSDSSTSGTYLGKYGSNGVYIPGITGHLAVSGASPDVVTASTASSVALQQPSNSLNRVVGNLDIGDSATIDLGQGTGDLLGTDTLRNVSVYAVDYDKQNIVEKVELINNDTGAILARQYLSDFKNGKYLTFSVIGDVSLKVTRLSSANAVVSGVFFD